MGSENAHIVVTLRGMMSKWTNCIVLTNRPETCKNNGSKMEDVVVAPKLKEESHFLLSDLFAS